MRLSQQAGDGERAAPQESVALSTYDAPAPIVAEDETVTAATECTADHKDCVPSDK
jgi:hypothetical protein